MPFNCSNPSRKSVSRALGALPLLCLMCSLGFFFVCHFSSCPLLSILFLLRGTFFSSSPSQGYFPNYAVPISSWRDRSAFFPPQNMTFSEDRFLSKERFLSSFNEGMFFPSLTLATEGTPPLSVPAFESSNCVLPSLSRLSAPFPLLWESASLLLVHWKMFRL